MKTQRILVPGDDQSTDAILLALNYGDALCKGSEGAVKDAILFIPGKDLIRSSTISTAIGDENAKKLHGGDALTLPSGAQLRLETVKTLGSIVKPSVLIAVYADQKMLDQVDAATNLWGIVAVPYAPDALSRWKSTWTPQVHGEQPQPPQQLIDDPVFEQALLSLSRSINLSHTLLNPRDKEYVDRILRILRINGHSQDAELVRSWAIKNQWQPKAADELERMAVKIQALKTKPKVADPEQARKIYEHWCSKV